MRIGINASFARKPNTGLGQVTFNFLQELARRQTKASRKKFKFFLYLEENLPKNLKLPRNFHKNIFLPLWKRDDLIRKIWWEKHLLPKKAKADKCDVLISLYQCPTIVAKDIKHLMVVHDIIPKLFPEYLNNSRKRTYQKMTEQGILSADKILAVSRRTEKDLIQKLKINPRKISVSYIDADEIYKQEVSAEKSAKILKKYTLKPGYILAGGGLEVRKNIEGVIRAYKHLLDRNKNTYLIKDFPKLAVYGKLRPELAPLITDAEKLVKEFNLSQRVKLLDAVPQADLPALYKNAAMFVYPSFYEGFGIPILEAMNQGIPVITAKTSSLPEVGSDAVLYCDPNDIREIAMVIKNVLTNEKLRDTLKDRGRLRAQHFSWKIFTDKIINKISRL
ncbi:MAG: glycosyltransferase family 1 protein [Candidatus Moranbacteria bacterium]|nr:glycosyltransferase family 1 protein [Candidatus Moranbacteria bacterium]